MIFPDLVQPFHFTDEITVSEPKSQCALAPEAAYGVKKCTHNPKLVHLTSGKARDTGKSAAETETRPQGENHLIF